MGESTGRQLYDRGWRQGAIVPINTPAPLYDGADSTTPITREPVAGYILATQDCDLVRPDDKLGHVELIAYHQVSRDEAANVLPNDTRHFVMSLEEGLVADRSQTLSVTKQTLLAFEYPPALPCGTQPTRTRRFARWLGARYDRPAVPDILDAALRKPLEKSIKKLCRSGKKLHFLNLDLHEIRVSWDMSGEPHRVALLFILRPGADVQRAEAAVAELLKSAKLQIADVVEPKRTKDVPILISRVVTASTTRISLEAYTGSVPLSFESFSVEGEAVVGAESLNADPS